MSAAAERLKTFRRLYRQRDDSMAPRDIAYSVYAGVLGVLVVAVPSARALVLAIAQPWVLQAVQAPEAGRIVGTAAGLLLAGTAAAGAVFGPVRLPPFFAGVLAGNDLSRRRTLLRPFGGSAIILTAIMVCGAAPIGAALSVSAGVPVAAVIRFSVAIASFGILSSVVWLIGQRIGQRKGWLLPTVLLGAVVLTWTLPDLLALVPWGWVGLAWPAISAATWAPFPLLLLAVAGVLFVPRLLDSLGGPGLLDQAHRWDLAAGAAVSGDLDFAFDAFRARPRLGRSWNAVAWTAMVPRFVAMDLIGTFRTPVRFIAGTAFLILAGVATALAYSMTELAWLPATIGSVLGYLAVGVFCDGLRHAAEAAVAPPLYGHSTARLYLLHSLLPALLAIGCATAGAALASLAGAGFPSVVCIILVSVFLVAVRAYDSAKGPLPLSLLAPVATPAGDLSGLVVLGWHADAPIIAALVGTMTTVWFADGTVFLGATGIAVALAAVVTLTARRLRNN
jgi:hypothetical protein